MKEVRIKSVLPFLFEFIFWVPKFDCFATDSFKNLFRLSCSRLREFFYQKLFFLLFFFAKIDMRALFFEDDFDSVQFRVCDLIFK